MTPIDNVEPHCPRDNIGGNHLCDDDEREREKHHGLKSWDEHGTKGAGQAANQQAQKYKNERHHTYATFLFRDVRQVSHLTGKSNVTNKVHESGMTSCTVQKREATRLRNTLQ